MTDARDTTDPDAGRTTRPARAGFDTKRLLTIVAQVVWALFALAALILAAGALLIALDANRDNSLVTFVLDTADALDLGLFDRDNGIKQWTGENAETKNALLNWGLAALAWLIVGKVLEKIVRPKA